MSKLLIDTNIVLDLLAKREPFYNSASKLFSQADKNLERLYVSTLTIANTNYILSKLRTAKEAKEILRDFRIIVKLVPLTDKTVDLALNDAKFQDYEDGLQYHSAIENKIDIIITRDLEDFKNSELPVMTAEEFLKYKEQIC